MLVFILGFVFFFESDSNAKPCSTSILLSGSACKDPAILHAVYHQLQHDKMIHLFSPGRSKTALARLRAKQAIAQARELYTQANFTGCISLLSIVEQDLIHHLADQNGKKQTIAFKLLADLNLWLGICQWAGGHGHAARFAFQRAAQIPRPSTPDPALFPPELIQAYRSALTSPEGEISCEIEPSIASLDVWIDGTPPLFEGNNVRLSRGIHYLAVKDNQRLTSAKILPTTPEKKDADSILQSWSYDAQGATCRIGWPISTPHESNMVPCSSLTEGRDAGFVGQFTREIESEQTVVISLHEGHWGLRLYQAKRTGFTRQIVAQRDGKESNTTTVLYNLRLLLDPSSIPPEPIPPSPSSSHWYGKWWVWALTGVTVAAITAGTLLMTTRSDTYKVVFGP